MEIDPEFRRCLFEMDVDGARSAWQRIAPHLVQPRTWDEAELTLHLARLQMPSLPDDQRAWSERWVAERKGDPIVVAAIGTAVGIAANASEDRKQRARMKDQAMAAAAAQAIQDGLNPQSAKDIPEIRRRLVLAAARG